MTEPAPSDARKARLATIRRAAFVAELRMRISRALAWLPPALNVGLALAAVSLAVRKTLPDHLSEHRARQLLVGAAAVVVLLLTVALLRRLRPRAGTLALDRYHDLSDRLTNALAFAALPAAERTPLMEIAIDDACDRAGSLRPGKAAPLRFPQELVVSVVFGAGVALVGLLEVRTPRRALPTAKTIDALSMSPDDVELFRDAAKQFNRQDQSPEMKAAVERFNQLIEDLANKRLDRTEAFRKMEAIERELLKGAEADAKSLEDALKETAEELKKSDLAKPVGESLDKKDLDKAKKDLKDLADQLRNAKKKPDKAALDRLRQALAKAASHKKETLAAVNERRAELREQLLTKKSKPPTPDGGAPSHEEENLLKKKERELERLDRDAEQKERAGRQLERLDRALAKAAEDLMHDLGMSADDLQQAAEDLNRMQDEQMSDKEKEELRQRLEELRELLRQQGQGGKQRMQRMMKFGRRAHGGKGGKGQKGQQGQGKDGEEQGEEAEGEGKDGEGKDGEGKDGEGNKPGGGGKQLVLGPGGKRLLIPGGSGQGPGQQGGGDSPGGDGHENGGDGQQPGGHGIGTGHDPNLAGRRTDPKMGTSDVQEQGLDTQQGASNSEVILSAAEKGFKGGGYKKVFTKYHTVAESQINKDQVPDGYRFYVHRYFQLIRPRE